MNNPDPKVPEKIAPRVFALASHLYTVENQAYSLAELIEAGGEAQIPPQFMRQALQQIQAEQLKQSHRQNKLKVALISTGAAMPFVGSLRDHRTLGCMDLQFPVRSSTKSRFRSSAS